MAQEHARADGAALLALLACPKCGFRPPDVVDQFHRTTARLRAAVVAFFLLVAAYVLYDDPESAKIVLPCMLVPCGLAMFLVGYLRTLRAEVPDCRVTFLSVEEAARLDAAAQDDEDEPEERPARRSKRQRRRSG
jgi:hypothetical protein